jgi:hypothetical protein
MTSSAKQYLDEIVASPVERYSGISTTDLLAYVLANMQEHGVRPTFEAIAVAAYRFFPEKFSLVGFPDYPDASRVGRTLLQCRPKYRNLVRGSASSQFTMTERGEARALDVAHRLANASAAIKRPRRGQPRAILDRMEQEVRDSSAFASWRDDRAVSDDDMYHFLHLLPGSSSQSVRENFGAIFDVARESQDTAIRDFLSVVDSQFIRKQLP